MPRLGKRSTLASATGPLLTGFRKTKDCSVLSFAISLGARGPSVACSPKPGEGIGYGAPGCVLLVFFRCGASAILLRAARACEFTARVQRCRHPVVVLRSLRGARDELGCGLLPQQFRQRRTMALSSRLRSRFAGDWMPGKSRKCSKLTRVHLLSFTFGFEVLTSRGSSHKLLCGDP